MKTEVLGGSRHMREEYDSQNIMVLHKQDLILLKHMINEFWIHLLVGLGHYFIHNGDIKKVLVMTTKHINTGYNYAIHSLKKLPDIISTLTEFGWILTWSPSKLALALDLQGKDQSLNCLRPATSFKEIE